MILLNSLIVLLLLLIIAHFIKVGWGNKKNSFKSDIEGFENIDVDQIDSYYGQNIANDLESHNSPHLADIRKTVQLPPQLGGGAMPPLELGGELAPSIGLNKLPAAQKAQAQARFEQTDEEDKTVGKHKKASDNALDMNFLKSKMDELLKLGNEAQIINESFKSF